MKNIKGNKAITLIALVITIIILLILAGVSIAQLTGNGLFEKSKLAKEKQQEAKEKEDTELDNYDNEIDSYVDSNRGTVTISQEEYNKFKSLISTDGSVLIYRPDTWVVGTEYCWKDGTSELYGRRYTGTTASNTTVATISDINIIKDFSIEVYQDGAQGPVSSGFWGTSNYVSGIYYAKPENPRKLYFAVSSNYVNRLYDLWLVYTK